MNKFVGMIEKNGRIYYVFCRLNGEVSYFVYDVDENGERLEISLENL